MNMKKEQQTVHLGWNNYHTLF